VIAPSNWIAWYGHRGVQVEIAGVLVEYCRETNVTQASNGEKWFGKGGNK
jgi:hypothetical protein